MGSEPVQNLTSTIKLGSKASLSTVNHRQKWRPEDRDAFGRGFEETFGKHCEQCGQKHTRHSSCQKGDEA